MLVNGFFFTRRLEDGVCLRRFLPECYVAISTDRMTVVTTFCRLKSLSVLLLASEVPDVQVVLALSAVGEAL